MKKSLLYSAVATATVIGITACSSGSDVAGIGGSGVTSSGTITGFGSIFVNGVEFETSSSTFSVDDNPGTESDLAVGMRVTVNGSINADGITGTATSVTFDEELQGPVSSVSPVDADGVSRTITVLGTTVLLNSTTTNFDISGTQPGPFGFNNINPGDNVEVSGFFNSTGVLIATRVELKEQTFVINSSIVELRGTITNLANTSFNLVGFAGISIDASVAAIDDLPSGLINGAFVEVKGTCPDISCTAIDATRVEGETDGFDDDGDVELEGIITRYVSDSDFDVDGFPVNATNAQKEPASLVLVEDLLVEVEGTIVNGILVASEVEQEDGEIKIAATVTGVPTANSFELLPVSGQPSITVTIDTSTEIEDEIADINSAALLNVVTAGDYIVVEGYDDGTGTVIAKSVHRETPDDVLLEGVVTATTGDATSGSVTVLGVIFPVDIDTDFEDENDMDYPDPNDFFTAITRGSSIVKIKDKKAGGGGNNAVGIADEVDLEQP